MKKYLLNCIQQCAKPKRMEASEILYRTGLCACGIFMYASLASYMAAYPHAHCS